MKTMLSPRLGGPMRSPHPAQRANGEAFSSVRGWWIRAQLKSPFRPRKLSHQSAALEGPPAGTSLDLSGGCVDFSTSFSEAPDYAVADATQTFSPPATLWISGASNPSNPIARSDLKLR